jgi:alkanesulfonate monooxygenase SsuD/methylene tetrahydromethanopterin reductase-like flavin-dependent oxidoreductase (luciferase family)
MREEAEDFMKFGIFDHIDDAGVPLGELYANRLTIAEAYERAGFYGYHVAEHHTTPLGAAASPALIFAALAQRTKTLRFGPLVYLLPFYHPLRLIEEVCMLDQMSGGRFQLGVGRGVSMYETQAYGLDFSKTQAMYHEAYQVLLKGLSSDELSFAGEFYKFDKLPMILKPVQKPHPPLWYGVGLPGNAAWPAENHINIVALGLRDTTQATVKAYREARAAKGFDLNGTLMGVSRHVVVADTDEAALAIARRAYPRWRQSFRWLFNRHGTEPRVIGIYPETFDALIGLDNGIAGSPATVRRFVEAEIAANNCNYFVPQMVFGDMTLKESLRSIELFGKEVMPAFAK